MKFAASRRKTSEKKAGMTEANMTWDLFYFTWHLIALCQP